MNKTLFWVSVVLYPTGVFNLSITHTSLQVLKSLYIQWTEYSVNKLDTYIQFPPIDTIILQTLQTRLNSRRGYHLETCKIWRSKTSKHWSSNFSIWESLTSFYLFSASQDLNAPYLKYGAFRSWLLQCWRVKYGTSLVNIEAAFMVSSSANRARGSTIFKMPLMPRNIKIYFSLGQEKLITDLSVFPAVKKAV